jgi:hypothetical protein
MLTVELLKEAIGLARQLGYQISEEWLNGHGGGMCELKGQKWLFLDLGLGPSEQLDVVVSALRGESDAIYMPMSEELRAQLHPPAARMP